MHFKHPPKPKNQRFLLAGAGGAFSRRFAISLICYPFCRICSCLKKCVVRFRFSVDEAEMVRVVDGR